MSRNLIKLGCNHNGSIAFGMSEVKIFHSMANFMKINKSYHLHSLLSPATTIYYSRQLRFLNLIIIKFKIFTSIVFYFQVTINNLSKVLPTEISAFSFLVLPHVRSAVYLDINNFLIQFK